jgi:hypothetical protein
VFLNLVLDEAVEERAGGEKMRLGMVVIILTLLLIPLYQVLIMNRLFEAIRS